MNILIAAATRMEIEMLTEELQFVGKNRHYIKSYQKSENNIDILITGIGTVSTAFRLTNALHQKKYDQIINIGIAGSLNPELKIGQVVNVITEEFADLGIEKREEFLTLFESGFIEDNEFPFENGILRSSYIDGFERIKKVHGVTSNISHGRSASISGIKNKFGADIETMEGAAVFYVCINMGVPCCQIRAISNYVEPRETSNWNIPLALENLKKEVLQIINNLTVPVN